MFGASRIAIPITNIAKRGEILRLTKQERIPFPRKEWIFMITWSDKHPQNRITDDETHNRANQSRSFDIESERRAGRRHCSSRRQTKQVTMRRDKNFGAEIKRKRPMKTSAWIRLGTSMTVIKEFDWVMKGFIKRINPNLAGLLLIYDPNRRRMLDSTRFHNFDRRLLNT